MAHQIAHDGFTHAVKPMQPVFVCWQITEPNGMQHRLHKSPEQIAAKIIVEMNARMTALHGQLSARPGVVRLFYSKFFEVSSYYYLKLCCSESDVVREASFEFPIGTYRFLFRGRGVLPAGFGLAQWRGQIGRALYRTACIVEAPDCLQSNCEFHARCAYPQIFRGVTVEAGPAGSDQGNTPPQPFALRAIPAMEGAEDTCGFEISLFGRANLALRSLLIAGAAMIEHGIPARDPTLVGELARLGCLDHATGQWRWSEDLTRLSIPPPATPKAGAQQPASARILLLTPVQLALAAPGQTPEPRAFTHALLTSLIRKVEVALKIYHPLAESGREVIEVWRRARHEVYPAAFAVRRARPGKHKSISLGGYLGHFELAGPGLKALMSLLALGQYIHAGKKATYGNGAFSLEPAHS